MAQIRITMLVAVSATLLTAAACSSGSGGSSALANDAPSTLPDDSGANQATDAGAPASCHGIELMADGHYDVDVRAIRVRGRVTLDGASVKETGPASLEFTRTDPGATRVVQPPSPTGRYGVLS